MWDGNEVWLLTAGGALFAAFAPAYATTFSGFYLAIMLVLMGLIVRAVSLEYRAHDPKWGRAWDILFFVGSLLPALLTGVAVGNIYAGIPLDANGDYTGIPLLGLVTPFTLLCGLLGLSVFLTQGATWLSLKAPKGSDLRGRAAALRVPLGVVSLVLFVHSCPCTGTSSFSPRWRRSWASCAGCSRILFVVAIVGAMIAMAKKGESGDLAAFLCSSASAVVLVVPAGRLHVPEPGGEHRGREHHDRRRRRPPTCRSRG